MQANLSAVAVERHVCSVSCSPFLVSAYNILVIQMVSIKCCWIEYPEQLPFTALHCSGQLGFGDQFWFQSVQGLSCTFAYGVMLCQLFIFFSY